MHLSISSARRLHLLLALLIGIVALALLRDAMRADGDTRSFSFGLLPQRRPVIQTEVDRRLMAMQRHCEEQDPFDIEYGRTNVRMSRAYEGSHQRLRQLLQKTLRGEPITISTLGGSITAGHLVYNNEIWFHIFGSWLDDFVGGLVTQVNGAAPATGSDYFSFCFPLHIPANSDLILVELAVNDEGILEHVEDMENLLRGLLDLPTQPAVVLVEALAFSNGGMGGGGGRMHLPVAQYYDVPVINQRHPLANHFARHPELVRPYFAKDFWQNPDTRHVNARGHRDLALLIGSLVKDVACQMLAEDMMLDNTANLPEQARPWRSTPKEDQQIGDLMPGMWMGPDEYGVLPRMKLLEGWNPNIDHVAPPFRPTCLSTRSTEARYNLTPSANDGWEYWVHPDHLDKPYLVARTPGAKVSFQLETSVGVIKLYALKSKTFGLGTIECWVGEDRHQSKRVSGWWDNGSVNIGRFATVRENLPAGLHTVTCELLEETSDPGGGHEFRMISMMSI